MPVRAPRLARFAGVAIGVAVAGKATGLLGAALPAAMLEQSVKASFLIKFPPFVEWPASAHRVTEKRFTLCLRGEDPFGATLDEVVLGQRIAGYPAQLRRLGEGDGAAGCDMLFAGRSSMAGYSPFAELAGQPVLTVTDQKSGVPGAMIKFVMQKGRVRFQIDDKMARASGLVISSKLLGLAVAVER